MIFFSSFWNENWGEEEDGVFSGRGFITAIKAQVESEWLFCSLSFWNICAYIDRLYIYP